MATSNNDRVSSARLLDMLKGLQESRHLGSEPEVDPQTNEKTKHTIKQDYLPNADWNVNDPDADGYVQGRTHWVEHTVGDIPVTTEQGKSAIPEMVTPEGFKTGTTTWKPDYEAIAFEGAESGMTYTGYLLAEDENGNQITDASSIFDGETFYTGVAIVDYSALAPNLYLVICRYNNEDVQADYVLGITEVVHKLDNKYIDFPKQPDLSIYVKNAKKSDYDIGDIFETARCLTSEYGNLYLIEYFTSNAVQSVGDFVNTNLFNVKTGSLADRLNYYMAVYGAEYVAASLWRAGATLTIHSGLKCFPSENFGEWTTGRDDYPYTVTFSTSKLGDKTFLKPSQVVYTITVPKHGISADSITDCFGHLGFEITLNNSNGDAIFIDKEKARFGFKRWLNNSTICPFNTDIAVFDTDLEFPSAEGYDSATNLSTSAYEYIKKCSGANVYLPLLDDNNNVVGHGWCEVYFDINNSLHNGSFAIKCRSLESTTATKFDLNVQTYVFWRNLSEVKHVS